MRQGDSRSCCTAVGLWMTHTLVPLHALDPVVSSCTIFLFPLAQSVVNTERKASSTFLEGVLRSLCRKIYDPQYMLYKCLFSFLYRLLLINFLDLLDLAELS